MKSLILIIVSLVGLNSFAKTACFCEIGDQPQWQQGFFKAGCGMWFARNLECSTREIVPEHTDYSQFSYATDVDKIAVGYVGHWGGWRATVYHVERAILPLMKEKGFSAIYDNTACESLDDPQAAFNWIKSLNLSTNQTLEVKGTQTLSVGEWTSIMGDNMNFPASVSSAKSAPEYIACNKIEGSPCMQGIHDYSHGKCQSIDGGLTALRCCAPAQDTMDFDAVQGATSYQWLQDKDCQGYGRSRY